MTIPHVIELVESLYLASEGAVCSLNGHFEYGLPQLPVTFVNTSDWEMVTFDSLYSHLDSLLRSDDVISPSFTKVVIVSFAKGCVQGPLELGGDMTCFNLNDQSINLPADGPYFLTGKKLHKAYRLYSDSNNAFMYGVVQRDTSPASFQRSPSSFIPVPSRCYFKNSALTKSPLLGKRVAVKDIYDLKGLRTGSSCKAYYQMQSPATKTAKCIEKLLKLGAIVVGKTKTVQFASGMSAGDWTEEVCPTNPRGDEQLDPDCSSSGSAVSIAAYPWLDYAIGSDSLGSMTGPAAACGIFGLRPTHGALSNIGGLPVSSLLDTPGHFARSIQDLSSFAADWFGKPTDLDSHGYLTALTEMDKPTRILVPEECFQKHVQPKVQLIQEFILYLETYCGVTATYFSIAKYWESSTLVSKGMKPLEEFISSTVANIQLYDSYHNNLEFRQGYLQKFGCEPAVDPLIRFKWDLGETISDAQYSQAKREKEMFSIFLSKEIFRPGTIMVLPGGDSDTSPRVKVSRTLEDKNKWQGFGLQNTTFSVLGGLPAVSVPIGQRRYHSAADIAKEFYQPVSVTILGSRDTDLWLIEQVKQTIIQSGMASRVQVGSNTFESIQK